MCGFAGQLRFDDAPIDRALVERMTGTLRHRGPDGEGFRFLPRIGLGHRRLALIDPAGSRQPIANEDGSLCFVGNHEFYNYQEMRAGLIARGHEFQSDGDAEVVLHRFEEIGAEVFSELVGMFAFALWDARTEALYLVRDPFGVKPLHFTRGSGGAFLFASELAALLQDPGVDRSLDPIAIEGYLRTLTIPEPATALRNVYKLPAGHFLRVSRTGTELHRYFELTIGDGTGRAPDSGTTDPRDVLAQLGEALDDTVRISLRSDVELGFFLSGGVDSSALVATAHRLGYGRLKTYSLGFDEPGFDERAYSRLVSEAFTTDHCELRLTSAAAVGVAVDVLSRLDEPFADSSALPTSYLARRAAMDVKGVLSGEGLDELFAGNFWHVPNADAFLPDRHGEQRDPNARLATPEELLDHPGRAIFTPSVLAHLYDPDFREQLACERDAPRLDTPALRPQTTIHAARELDQRLAFDLRTYLPSDMLTKMDRLPMAASLEVRVPYLNLPFARFVAGMDWSDKVRGGVQKFLMKQLLRGVLPDVILDRPKRGFAVPLDVWLWKDGPFRAMVEDVLRDRRTEQRGLFDAARVRTMLEEHGSLTALHGHRLWTLFVLEMWQRSMLDRSSTNVADAAREGVA